MSEMSGEQCPLCSSAGLPRRFTVRLPYGRIHTCRDCGSGVLLPRPADVDLKALHSTSEYFAHPYFEARRSLSPELRATFAGRRAIIEKTHALRGASVLEVGCDSGVFLEYLQGEAGAVTSGVDVSSHAVERARSHGFDVRHGALEDVRFEDESFDVVCAFDLIEHVARADRFLTEVRRVLKPRGLLVIETPNYDGLVYRLGRVLGRAPLGHALFPASQQRLWPAFHVQYFTRPSLAALLAKAGFEPRVWMRELAARELAVEGWRRPVLLGAFAFAKAMRQQSLLVGTATPA